VRIVQPTLPGVGPEECGGDHVLRPAKGAGWGRLWKRCARCYVGVFTLRRTPRGGRGTVKGR
jgi:hypothetical protein